MFVFNRKRISLMIFALLIGIFAYSYELSKANIRENIKETSSVPSTGKVIVVDAGHRQAR